jgi:hypothetical protein
MDSRPEIDFARLIAALAGELAKGELPFMVIGGQAVLLHGRPRLTEDIDITLGAGPEGLMRVLAVCRALELEPLPADPEDFVRETFVLPAAHRESRQRVDFIFSTTPYERQAIERAVLVELAGVDVPFASAEDLLIHKLFAGRARDLEDAEGVVRRQAGRLDWGYLDRWAAEFSVIPGREAMPEQVHALRRQDRGSAPD